MAQESSPIEQMAEQAAEAIPGLATAPKLAAIQQHWQMMQDHRKRVNDSHRWQALALGMPDPGALPEEDMGGNLIICGDITTTNPAATIGALTGNPVQGTDQQVQTQTPQAEPKQLSTLAKTGIAAALLASGAGAGAGIPWALGAFDQQPPAVVQTAPSIDTNTQYELQLVPPTGEEQP